MLLFKKVYTSLYNVSISIPMSIVCKQINQNVFCKWIYSKWYKNHVMSYLKDSNTFELTVHTSCFWGLCYSARRRYAPHDLAMTSNSKIDRVTEMDIKKTYPNCLVGYLEPGLAFLQKSRIIWSSEPIKIWTNGNPDRMPQF